MVDLCHDRETLEIGSMIVRIGHRFYIKMIISHDNG